MKRILLSLIIPALLISVSVAENGSPFYSPKKTNLFPKKSAKFDPSRLTYGGNFGATFGSVTYVDISPLIGYRVTDRLISGVGVTYIYYRQRFQTVSGNTFTYQTNLYGGRIFSQYSIFPNIFVHGEIEALNFDYYDFLSGENTRAWFTTPIVGAGLTQPMAGTGSFRIMALYAFNTDNPKSPYYQQPLIFRVGFFL